MLLSNVSDAPRIDAIQNQAVDAQEQIAQQRAEREDKINDLITDENDDLDPVV